MEHIKQSSLRKKPDPQPVPVVEHKTSQQLELDSSSHTDPVPLCKVLSSLALRTNELCNDTVFIFNGIQI
jgi:hypothetical protein